jgi:hypothetical protein
MADSGGGRRWRRFTARCVAAPRAGVARHVAFLAVAVAGVTLRALVWRSLPPATWFAGDSFSYVTDAVGGAPGLWRPSGYSLLLLRPLLPAHSLALVTAVQHALGVAVGVLVYALLLRHGLPRWVAVPAAAPLLLDAYTVSVEQMLLSEALFTALLVAAVALLLWRPARPGAVACSLVGLLLGLSAVTRTVGVPLVAVAAATALARRAGFARVGALLLAAALPLAGYAAWFHASHGRWGASASGGLFLYGRVAQFVDCGAGTSARPRALCPPEPRGHRHNVTYYVFSARSPVQRVPGDMVRRDEVAGRFARRVVADQPGDYAMQSWRLFVGEFSVHDGRPADRYRFGQVTYVPPSARPAVGRYQRGNPNTVPDRRGVAAVRAYQRWVWVPGVACLAALLLGLLGAAVGRDADRRGLRSAVLLLCGSSLVLFALPALTVGPDMRYRLPALPLLAVAAPLGLLLVVRRAAALRRVPRPGPGPSGGPADVETTSPDLT